MTGLMASANLKETVETIFDAHVARRADELLSGERLCSMAHLVVSRPGAPCCTVARGTVQLVPERIELEGSSPVFDLASITKALVPATLCMIAVDRGLCRLDTPLAALLPDWKDVPTGPQATLLHLLNHSSGLPAWHKYYEDERFAPFPPEPDQMEALRARVLQDIFTRERHPAGERHAYSDLGYMLLMPLLEGLFGAPLDELAEQLIFAPLGMTQTSYIPLQSRKALPWHEDAVVATEVTPQRGAVRGVVHDENTHLIGGVSGHAGVFGTAEDLARFGEHLLAIDSSKLPANEGVVSRRTLQSFWDRSSKAATGHHVAGWDTPSGQRSSAGRGFQRGDTVGHLGFTGTSIWLERTTRTCAVLLTNRVHPTREQPGILDMRIAVHEAILSPEG